MLVPGVDQLHRTESGRLEDDSKIPPNQRKEIELLLGAGTSTDIDKVAEKTVAELEPIVQKIRRKLPQAKISALLPGPM
jgi:hypothetical protein